jgi:hypothetical protein
VRGPQLRDPSEEDEMYIRKAIGAVIFLLCGLGASAAALPVDGWSPPCTPDLIHVYPTVLSTHCKETNRWYHIWNASHPNGHVERLARMIQAVQFAGKKVKFHDMGQLGADPQERIYDTIALPQ